MGLVAVAGWLVATHGSQWYWGLADPLPPRPRAGTTVWEAPPGTAGATLDLPAEINMPRNQAEVSLRNPQPATPESTARGTELYAAYCALCHGPEGNGDGPMAAKLLMRPPSLSASLARHADGYIYATIRNGGPVMPSFADRIPSQERWHIVNYLRSTLAVAPPIPAGAPSTQAAPEPAPDATPEAPDETQLTQAPQPDTSTVAADLPAGDPVRGRQLFESQCQLCHDPASNMAGIGPGLKDLFNWPAHTLADGTEHAEHSDSVIRRHIKEGSSAMPPFGAALSQQQLDDIMAHLRTL